MPKKKLAAALIGNYVVTDPTNTDRTLVIGDLKLVFKRDGYEKLPVTGEVATALLAKHPYLKVTKA